MGVSVIAESGLEMTKLNDLREEDEGKIKKKITTIIAMRRYILLLLWDSSISTLLEQVTLTLKALHVMHSNSICRIILITNTLGKYNWEKQKRRRQSYLCNQEAQREEYKMA